MEPYSGEEGARINKGLARVYFLLFALSLTTIVTSIISSESRPHFEMRLRQQEGLVICTNNMPAEGLDCQAQAMEGGEVNTRHIEGAEIVKEYAMKLPRKSNVEGLGYIFQHSTQHYLLLSTGSYGGSLDVLKLDENG